MNATDGVYLLSIQRYDWNDTAIFSSLSQAQQAGTQAMERARALAGDELVLPVPAWAITPFKDCDWALTYLDSTMTITRQEVDTPLDWFT